MGDGSQNATPSAFVGDGSGSMAPIVSVGHYMSLPVRLSVIVHKLSLLMTRVGQNRIYTPYVTV